MARHTTLTRLELLMCELSCLSPQLSAFSALRHLNLSNNIQLHTGWEHLAGLAALTLLNMLDCGSIADLPQQFSMLRIGRFSGLRCLSLGHDRPIEGDWYQEHGEELPEPAPLPSGLLLRFPELEQLNLLGCGIDSLHEQLSSLHALSSLSLHSCALSLGLSEMADWQSLASLVRLTQLRLWGCRLAAVPAELEELSLLSTGLTTVPPSLAVLTRLTALNLGDNRQMATGWHRLYLLPLSHLTHLSLKYCDIDCDRQPPELAALRARARVFF
ncbi:hypothetical protein ABPG75_012926 [Micractinium tetrahymenae]